MGKGLLIIILTLSGKLGMEQSEASITKMITQVALKVTEVTSSLPGLDIVFTVIVAYLLYKFFKKMN